MKKNRTVLLLCIISLFFVSTSVYAYDYNAVSCGNITDIPGKIPDIVSYCISLMQVAVPIILVIISSIDFVKAIIAQKEDEIKKGQHLLIKRIIVAIIIFAVIALIKLVVSLVANSSESKSIINCVDCFIEGSDSESCVKVESK